MAFADKSSGGGQISYKHNDLLQKYDLLDKSFTSTSVVIAVQVIGYMRTRGMRYLGGYLFINISDHAFCINH